MIHGFHWIHSRNRKVGKDSDKNNGHHYFGLGDKDKASERALKQMRTEMNVLRWEKEEKNEEGEKNLRGTH